MKRVPFVGLLVLLIGCVAAFSDSHLVVLEGSFIQDTEYVYRLTLEPDGRTLDANVALLDPVDQPWYRVDIFDQSFTANAPWSSDWETTDSNGNRTAKFMWSNAPAEVTLERHVRATSEAVYGPIALDDPFPVDKSSLPWSVRSDLQPTDQAQCNDSTIASFANGITAQSPTQLDAVVRILSWIRHEVRYACSAELCDPVYRIDAVFTMQKKMGNCVSYANLAIAMLRAAGIPAVDANGFVADRAESNASHAWIAVYFPSFGWIEFESADWMPAYREAPLTFLMPQHITMWIDASDLGVSRARFSERHEASFEIRERPEEKTYVEAQTSAGKPLAWVLTVKNPVYEDSTIDLSIENVPTGWSGVLTETRVLILDGAASRSVDVLFTVIPAESARSGTTEEIIVVGSHKGDEIGRVTFSITVP